MTFQIEKYRDDLQAVLNRTNKEKPNKADLVALREMFDTAPDIYRTHGNIGELLQKQIIDSIGEYSALIREAMTRYILELKNNLGYENAPFLEQLLIDEIAMRWLRLQVMEHDHKNVTYQNHSITKGLYYDKRLDLAQNRYLRSLQALAKIRKFHAEANLRDEQARNCRSKSAKTANDLLRQLTQN